MRALFFISIRENLRVSEFLIARVFWNSASSKYKMCRKLPSLRPKMNLRKMSAKSINLSIFCVSNTKTACSLVGWIVFFTSRKIECVSQNIENSWLNELWDLRKVKVWGLEFEETRHNAVSKIFAKPHKWTLPKYQMCNVFYILWVLRILSRLEENTIAHCSY